MCYPPLINPVTERHIHTRGKFFKYKLVGRVYGNDGFIVNESLKEAFCLILDTYMSLKNKDAKSLKIAREILGNLNYKTLLGSIDKVGLKILDNVLVILRENYLDTENDNVLASVDKDDKKTFTVYDNFFDQVGFMENRAGIFIHEIAHLCDFDEEDEMRELDSAECIKNICLCINGKITLEQIKAEHKKQQENPQRDRRDGVLTYRPNPNRRANGQFDFGPDSGSGGGSGSAGNSEKSSSSINNKNQTKETPEPYKEDPIFTARKSNDPFVEKIREYVGSDDWSFYSWKSNFRWRTDKCNLFVGEALEENGQTVPRINDNTFFDNYPLANQWANRAQEIEGYEIVSDPMPGDIIAFKNPKGAGHVGIVSGNRIYISASAEKIEEKAYRKLKGYGGLYSDIVFRRYINK